MSMILFKDISQWQGDYNMAANPDPAIAIKMSGGDNGLYYDSKASINYARAAQAGKVVIGYHFAGGTDPIAEAEFMVRSMSPLEENDILALDWEVHPAGKDPVQWCLEFVNRVHEMTGLWCLVYMNMSTANAYDWSPIFNNCGYWCAAPSFTFDETLPVKYPQVAQQGAIVNGVDTNAFFGTIDQLKKYGWHATPAPTPPVVEPTPPVAPVEPTPTPPTTPDVPVVTPPVIPTPPVVLPPVVDTPAQSWIKKIIAFIYAFFGITK